MQALSVSIPEIKKDKVVALISCVSKKMNTDDGPVVAKDLYQSPLFIKSLEYVTKVLHIEKAELSQDYYPLNISGAKSTPKHIKDNLKTLRKTHKK